MKHMHSKTVSPKDIQIRMFTSGRFHNLIENTSNISIYASIERQHRSGRRACAMTGGGSGWLDEIRQMPGGGGQCATATSRGAAVAANVTICPVRVLARSEARSTITS